MLAVRVGGISFDLQRAPNIRLQRRPCRELLKRTFNVVHGPAERERWAVLD